MHNAAEADAGAFGSANATVGAGAALRSEIREGRLILLASGPWTAEHARTLDPLIDAAGPPHPSVEQVVIEMSAVEHFDTFGAWLVERLARSWHAEVGQVSVVGLAAKYQTLLREVHSVNKEEAPPLHHPYRIGDGLELIGRTIAASARDLIAIVDMIGAVAAAMLRVLVRPNTFRFTSVVHHLDRVGFRAVPIILLITFLIGAIIAQQGIFHFRKFGADIYVIDMLGILILREVGVLIVAVMVSGRSGSAYTAELGSMKMREEIDALQTMGFDPVEVLVLPRMVALIIALPMLTFLGSIAALYGGGLVCWLYGGIDPEIFMSRLKEAISVDHFQVGMIKAPFIAVVIGIVACVEGMRTLGSAESLGLQTTAAVVKANFLTIVLDGMFAMFFATIGK
jgi:phospholipid/cholesterol/gamma-HCH transport system permease protein